MRVLFFFMRGSPKVFLAAATVGVLSGVGTAALMAVINSSLSQPFEAREGLLYFVPLALGVIAASGASGFLLATISGRTLSELRLRIGRGILRLPLRRIEEIGGARLIATLTSDVESLSGAAPTIPHVLSALAVLVGCCVYLGQLSLVGLAITLAFVGGGIKLSLMLMAPGGRLFYSARGVLDQLFKHMEGLILGIKELKMNASRREVFERDLFGKAVIEQGQLLVKARIGMSSGANLARFVFVAAAGVAAFGLPHVVPMDEHAQRGFVMTILFMQARLEAFAAVMGNLGSWRAAIDRIEAITTSLATSPSEQLTAGKDDHDTFSTIELQQVVYQHQSTGDSAFRIGPIDLSIRRGEILFIIGGNGSGKTSLAKVLTGLYPPSGGQIRLDGRVVDASSLDAYRQNFSIIFLDFHLFESILGVSNPDLDRLAATYLSKLGLAHKVLVENGRFSTTQLSQGQRKRLALLTAYLDDRPVFMFDEWAADQDPEFKRVFYEELLPELRQRNKTVIVISHDDQYFHVADRVIRLRDGALLPSETTTQRQQLAVELT
jgi:putative pyoverdin transport system ATP-binding/permease protein